MNLLINGTRNKFTSIRLESMFVGWSCCCQLNSIKRVSRSTFPLASVMPISVQPHWLPLFTTRKLHLKISRFIFHISVSPYGVPRMNNTKWHTKRLIVLKMYSRSHFMRLICVQLCSLYHRILSHGRTKSRFRSTVWHLIHSNRLIQFDVISFDFGWFWLIQQITQTHK